VPSNIRRVDKLSEVIARELVDEIVRDQLGEEDTLPSEAAMAARFKVGRGTLREALRILEVLGLIVIKTGPGGGPVVKALTSHQFARTSTFYFNVAGVTFRQVEEARQLLEPLMARQAASNVTKAFERSVRENVRQTQRSEGDEWVHATRRFHQLIRSQVNNPVLDLYGGSLMTLYSERIHEGAAPLDRDVICGEHEEIAEALLSRSPDKAEALMRAHLISYMSAIDGPYSPMLDEVIGWASSRG